MGFLSKLLGSPVRETMGAVGELLGKFIADPQEKLKAQLELTRIENEFQQKIIEADVEWAKAQADVIKTEAQSASWLARSWRPLLMLTFNYIILHTYIIAPIFGVTPVVIPEQMWDLLKIGIGGYVVGRSLEKTAPTVVQALRK